MYLIGFVAALLLGRLRAHRGPWRGWSPRGVDDALFYVLLGMVLDGRLGYVWRRLGCVARSSVSGRSFALEAPGVSLNLPTAQEEGCRDLRRVPPVLDRRGDKKLPASHGEDEIR
jgi:hypothetical protein